MSSRIRFFSWHLCLSLFIAIILLGIVFILWYPAPLAKAAGVTEIFLMLLAIDVIVGPLLTLLVYKEGKKTLKMDLSMIVIMQLAALLYGVYNIEQGRPVWLVFQNQQFEFVRHTDLISENIGQAVSQYQTTSWFEAPLVAVKSGQTIEEKNKLLFLEMETGVPAAYRPEYYQPVENARQELLSQGQSLNLLKQFNIEQEVEKILAQYPHAKLWVPLRVMMGVDMVVLIDEKGNVIKIVDLRPWSL